MKESRDVRGLAWGLLFLFLCPVAFLLVMTFIDDHTRADENTALNEEAPAEETPSGVAPADGAEATPAPQTPADATPQDGTPVSQLPATDVSFSADIVPIFELHCYQCHGPTRIPGVPTSYSLVSYDTTLRGGFIPAVQPGEPDKSSLYLAVATGDMPRTGEKLSADEVDLIRRWILQGAPNN